MAATFGPQSEFRAADMDCAAMDTSPSPVAGVPVALAHSAASGKRRRNAEDADADDDMRQTDDVQGEETMRYRAAHGAFAAAHGLPPRTLLPPMQPQPPPSSTDLGAIDCTPSTLMALR